MVHIGRLDIIGDLARLHREVFTEASLANCDPKLDELEILAAAAITHGVSHAMVGRVSGIPRERIDALLDALPARIEAKAVEYVRQPIGTVVHRDSRG